MAMKSSENFDLDGYFDRRELQRRKEAEADEQMRKLTKGIQSMGEKLDKVAKSVNGVKNGARKTLANFTLQEMWNHIKASDHGEEDMKEIFSDRFANDPEFRKQALDKLSKEDFTEDAKTKRLDGKLDALCADEACRAELEKMIREAKRKK